MFGGGPDGLGSYARRIAEGCGARGQVAGNHTTGAYQGIVTDGHARQDDRAAADPDIAPDVDWATKLQPGGPPSCIAWVIGREDLNPWTDLRFVANGDLHDVEDNAVEVQEHACTENDVDAVVAVKRRPNTGTLANRSEAVEQQFPAAQKSMCQVPRCSVRATRAPLPCPPEARARQRCTGPPPAFSPSPYASSCLPLRPNWTDGRSYQAVAQSANWETV